MSINTRLRRVCCILVAAMLTALVPSHAAAQSTADEVVIYRAPAGDLAPRRVNGGARSGAEPLPGVAVLAPDHLALTVSERPILLWYLSAPTRSRIELALIDPRRDAPVIEAVVPGNRAGIQAFRMDPAAGVLEPGVAYEWSVAVIADPGQRSRDVVASGAIMRVATSASLTAKLAGADARRRAAALASEGVWYDALAILTAELDSRPDDGEARASRAAILEQAGLPEVAVLDRRP